MICGDGGTHTIRVRFRRWLHGDKTASTAAHKTAIHELATNVQELFIHLRSCACADAGGLTAGDLDRRPQRQH